MIEDTLQPPPQGTRFNGPGGWGIPCVSNHTIDVDPSRPLHEQIPSYPKPVIEPMLRPAFNDARALDEGQARARLAAAIDGLHVAENALMKAEAAQAHAERLASDARQCAGDQAADIDAGKAMHAEAVAEAIKLGNDIPERDVVDVHRDTTNYRKATDKAEALELTATTLREQRDKAAEMAKSLHDQVKASAAEVMRSYSDAVADELEAIEAQAGVLRRRLEHMARKAISPHARSILDADPNNPTRRTRPEVDRVSIEQGDALANLAERLRTDATATL